LLCAYGYFGLVALQTSHAHSLLVSPLPLVLHGQEGRSILPCLKSLELLKKICIGTINLYPYIVNEEDIGTINLYPYIVNEEENYISKIYFMLKIEEVDDPMLFANLWQLYVHIHDNAKQFNFPPFQKYRGTTSALLTFPLYLKQDDTSIWPSTLFAATLAQEIFSKSQMMIDYMGFKQSITSIEEVLIHEKNEEEIIEVQAYAKGYGGDEEDDYLDLLEGKNSIFLLHYFDKIENFEKKTSTTKDGLWQSNGVTQTTAGEWAFTDYNITGENYAADSIIVIYQQRSTYYH
ncbi:hypothetical protein ACJX0J_012323, partial [Zea mays]